MAEIMLRIKVEAGKDFFHFYDKTGVYDKDKNDKGWNGPNNKISDVEHAVVRVYKPKETESYSEIKVFPDLPNVNCVGMEIIPEDLSLKSFSPGVYKFDYVVTLRNGHQLAQSIYFYHSEPLCCCLTKKRFKLSPIDSTSDDSKKVMEIELLVNNAQWMADQGDLKKTQEIVDLVWLKCGCCC